MKKTGSLGKELKQCKTDFVYDKVPDQDQEFMSLKLIMIMCQRF